MKKMVERRREADRKSQEGYCRMPKFLFTDPKYRDIATEAKVLYTFMLDRLALSKRNNWLDRDGNTYIFFTMQEAMELLNVGHEKAVRLFAMLDQEKGVGLIRRKKLGQGRPTMIYVREPQEPGNPQNKQNPGIPKTGSQKLRKSERNKTEWNNNNGNSLSINPDITERAEDTVQKRNGDRVDAAERAAYEEIVKENIEQEILLDRHPYDQETIRGIADLIADAVTSRRKTIRLDCQDVPQEIVKSRFLKLNFSHIEYVLERLAKNMTKIRNFKSYLLTVLFNAPVTMGAYYSAEVARDFGTEFA